MATAVHSFYFFTSPIMASRMPQNINENDFTINCGTTLK
ncbi:hypothetical protein CHCC20331_0235 [Bacillus paralicheniformis]|nr:hypothetical protein CHCC20331_0235 [Bacillus paralicheniformis]